MDTPYSLSLKLFFFRYASLLPNMIDEKLSRLYPECHINLSQILFRVGHKMFGLPIYVLSIHVDQIIMGIYALKAFCILNSCSLKDNNKSAA